jgi:hypothetical protein
LSPRPAPASNPPANPLALVVAVWALVVLVWSLPWLAWPVP